MGDKGVAGLAVGLQALVVGTARLALDHCGITLAGVRALLSALKANGHYANTLTDLCLAGNKLGAEGAGAVGTFATSCTRLQRIDMGDTGASLASTCTQTHTHTHTHTHAQRRSDTHTLIEAYNHGHERTLARAWLSGC
jgi:hypothetical protein